MATKKCKNYDACIFFLIINIVVLELLSVFLITVAAVLDGQTILLYTKT